MSRDDGRIEELLARVTALEARVGELEAQAAGGGARRSSVRRASSESAGGGAALDAFAFTTRYATAQLTVEEGWIELHEHSARPQLQRLIREVVEVEGPVTERLVLDRVRRAWGLRRAGGRVQEAFEQAVRQLVARALVERSGDALRLPGRELTVVRVPDPADDDTKRGAEDVPLVELVTALREVRAQLGTVDDDELTMQVAKVFGWTRRGGAIQERLDAALTASRG